MTGLALNASAVNRQGLLDLLTLLDGAGYDFAPPTPLTHQRALANGGAERSNVLRRLFGWSCIIDQREASPELVAALANAGVLERHLSGIRSTVRIARRGTLFVHSAFPTDDVNAVFFGPDSYRFAQLIEREIVNFGRGVVIVDIGTGSGIGALTAARLCVGARVIGTDINSFALELASVNAEYAGHSVEFVETDSLDGIGKIDLALANPPYIVDASKRRYRDGGDALGTGVAIAMATVALAALKPGGRLILYTGSPIVRGHDPLRAVLGQLSEQHGAILRYSEIDPDVFGEELERTEYAGVERIALIAAVAQRVRL